MISVRKSEDRGHADHGWLKTYHSFSFADYYNPAHMGFGNLRVLNDDRIAPGTGFGTHGHRDMEIVTYVLQGGPAHKDSMGNGQGGSASGVIRPGDVQRMSAGRGVMHSEFNHSKEEATHLLQIWLLPERAGIDPSYEQTHFADAGKRGRLQLIAARDGRDGAVTLHADAAIRAGLFDGDEAAELALDPQRLAYLHVARGEIVANGQPLSAGDALLLSGEAALKLERGRDAEVLAFDLAPRA